METNLKLKSILVLNGDTIRSLAKEMKVNYVTLLHKVNGKTQFTVPEVLFIKNKYHLSAEQVDDIFF